MFGVAFQRDRVLQFEDDWAALQLMVVRRVCHPASIGAECMGICERDIAA